MLITVVTIIDDEGEVMACEADYDQTAMRHWTIEKSQVQRAEAYAWRAAMVAECRDEIAAIISLHKPMLEQIGEHLLQVHGWSIERKSFHIPERST